MTADRPDTATRVAVVAEALAALTGPAALTARKVRRCRRIIAREVCKYGRCTGLRPLHSWRFDGYFWHHCSTCGRVS